MDYDVRFRSSVRWSDETKLDFWLQWRCVCLVKKVKPKPKTLFQLTSEECGGRLVILGYFSANVAVNLVKIDGIIKED